MGGDRVKWGSIKFDGLDALIQRLEEAQANVPALLCACADSLAANLHAQVTELTPVGKRPMWAFLRAEEDDIVSVGDGVSKRERLEEHWKGYVGGELKKSWKIRRAASNGNTANAFVYNNTQYARYVEYGHRQTPGRYVPAIGLQLKESWAGGSHMLETARKRTDAAFATITESEVNKFMSAALKGGYTPDE